MGAKTQLSGMRFGRLLVTQYVGDSKWMCVCDCGVTTSVTTKRLKNGNTKSCGCLQKERASESRSKHGMSRKPVYQVWRTIKSRCLNPNDHNYKNYGGRGITICESWLESFENFFADMGEPEPGMSIDRINVDLGYSPENCRWVSQLIQQNNRRTNVYLEYQGKTLTLSQWSRTLGINPRTLKSRIDAGMTIDRVLSPKNFSEKLTEEQLESVLPMFPNKNRLVGLSRIAAELGVHKDTLRKQIQERLFA